MTRSTRRSEPAPGAPAASRAGSGAEPVFFGFLVPANQMPVADPRPIARRQAAIWPMWLPSCVVITNAV